MLSIMSIFATNRSGLVFLVWSGYLFIYLFIVLVPLIGTIYVERYH